MGRLHCIGDNNGNCDPSEFMLTVLFFIDTGVLNSCFLFATKGVFAIRKEEGSVVRFAGLLKEDSLDEKDEEESDNMASFRCVIDEERTGGDEIVSCCFSVPDKDTTFPKNSSSSESITPSSCFVFNSVTRAS